MKAERTVHSFENYEPRRWQGPDVRWGSGERADVDVARLRLMKAAQFCFRRLGLTQTSMADIAAQAKVTRPTVYRYFSNREGVLYAVLRMELHAFWSKLELQAAGAKCFSDYLVEVLHGFLCEARTDQGAILIFSHEAHFHLREILLEDYAIPGAACHPVYAYALRPGARIPENLTAVVEWFNRMALSYLGIPTKATSDELRELLIELCPWKNF